MLTGDYDGPGVVTMSTSDRAINQTKLIKYLMDKGARINPQNADMYKKAYFNYVMPSYERLYESRPENLYDPDYGIEKFKELFKELDPILEEIIPGFKEEVKKARQERADIETNPDKYKKEVEESESRAEYMDLKARRMSDDYNQSVGDAHASHPHNFADKVKFDGQEYQAWVKSGKPNNFFNRYRGNFNARFEQNNFNQGTPAGDQSTNDVLLKLKIDLGLPVNASAIDVKKKFREISMLNHPDKREQGKATMTEEEYTNLNSAYSSVSEILDKQAREEAAQMRKAAQQKAQQANE